MSEKEKFSFSKLSCYGNCPKNYYLTYIESVERSQNIYGMAGGDAHEIVQALEIGKISNKEAVTEWESKMNMYDFFGEAKFPTIKSKENYIADVTAYFRNFKPLPINGREVLIEKEFEVEIEGIIIRGFIDLTLIDHDKKEIEVIDYKTSSKSGFTSKSLVKKCYQLILYSLALQKLYPDYKIVKCAFDMLKYGTDSKGKVKERKNIKLEKESEYERYFIEIPFNQENIDLFKKFVNESMNNINKAKEKNIWNVDKTNFSFFCKFLCSTAEYCQEYQKYNKVKRK